MNRKREETKMINFLVLSLLKILFFFPLISNGEIFEGDCITCSEQDIQNDKQLNSLKKI